VNPPLAFIEWPLLYFQQNFNVVKVFAKIRFVPAVVAMYTADVNRIGTVAIVISFIVKHTRFGRIVEVKTPIPHPIFNLAANFINFSNRK
jgi:hypothetical protein